MLSELLENEVLSVAFYGEETVWNSRCVYVSLCVCVCFLMPTRNTATFRVNTL